MQLPAAIPNGLTKEARLAAIDNEEAGLKLRHSFAGRIGRFIEPLIAPLGFDWKMGIGIVSSFAAREVFVSTMSLVYGVGKYDRSHSSLSKLEQTLRQQKRPNGAFDHTTPVIIDRGGAMQMLVAASNELQALDPEVCAIACSGYANDPIMCDHAAFGFADALEKPFRFAMLARVVRRLMARKHRPQARVG